MEPACLKSPLPRLTYRSLNGTAVHPVTCSHNSLWTMYPVSRGLSH